VCLNGLSADGATTHFVYDRQGRLLADSESDGTPGTEYLWLGDRPVALVDHTGANVELYFLHTDQFGRPDSATDSSGTTSWEAQFGPFGEIHSMTGSLVVPLRFSGQVYDPELRLNIDVGLNYDSTLGRYTAPKRIQSSGELGSNLFEFRPPVAALVAVPWPIVVPVVEALAAALARTLALLTGAAIGDAASERLRKGCEKCGECKTVTGKVVPIDTVGCRDMDTPEKPQHGIDGPHYNCARSRQIPYPNCDCFWSKNFTVPADQRPPGAIKMEEFAN
jgi:type VI secretion system secreted protein VgrG